MVIGGAAMFRKLEVGGIIGMVVMLTLGVPMGSVRVLAASTAGAGASQVLSLKAGLELAYQNSAKLKVVVQKTAIAGESVTQAEAAYRPAIDYQVSATNQESEPEQIYGGGISATQPLYTFGRLTNNLELARTQLDNARQDELKIKQELTYNVIEAYYKVWVAEQSLIVATNSLENMGRHYQQVKRFYETGNASKFELLRAEVQWESLRPAVIKAQNEIALAKLSVATLIGWPQETAFTVSFDPESLPLPEEIKNVSGAIVNEAYQNRPEMRQIQIAAVAAHLKTALAEAEYRPKLGLKGEYNRAGTEFQPFDWEPTWSLTLAVTGNLYNGSATRSKVNASRQEEAINTLQETALRDQIRLEVEQALQNQKESLETIKSNRFNMELARESLRLSQARFDAGMGTTVDIMDAQLDLDKALNGYYQGIYSYLTANAKLDLVTGRSR
jgi:outer membrane protein